MIFVLRDKEIGTVLNPALVGIFSQEERWWNDAEHPIAKSFLKKGENNKRSSWLFTKDKIVF